MGRRVVASGRRLPPPYPVLLLLLLSGSLLCGAPSPAAAGQDEVTTPSPADRLSGIERLRARVMGKGGDGTPVHRARAHAAEPKLEHLDFLHIPKTGTSIIIALRRYLDACIHNKNATCPGKNGGTTFESHRDDRPNEPFFLDLHWTPGSVDCDGHLYACGHAGRRGMPGYHDPLTEKRLRAGGVVVMLRDPVERLMSVYRWYLTDPGYHHMPPMTPDNVLRIAKKEPARLKGHNMMTRMITGRAKGAPPAASASAFRILRDNVTFFGLTERWAESLCLFHCMLPGGTTFDPVECTNTRPTLNMTADERRAAPALRDQPEWARVAETLEELNSQDVELYADAEELFEARLEEHATCIKRQRCRCP